MSATFEDLRVLKTAEEIADSVWKKVIRWDDFARDVVGKQLTRAVDSIGANIAESFGRYHFGEKLQFLYYARGSLFETKYWLNRVKTRALLSSSEAQTYIEDLTDLARQLNTFAGSLKTVRNRESKQSKTIREMAVDYRIDLPENSSDCLFSDEDLNWLET
ncbi:MAG TPA: four helix bundle protein [Anaerolineales bacterium]|nr:four helix bundle protein [Anaerolineales bacterium]